MRRWASRVALIVLALATLLAAPISVRVFNRACDGSLEGLRYLSNVRAEIAAATAPPPTPAAPPTPTLVPTATPTSAVPAQATAVPTVQPTATVPPTPAPPTPTPAGPTIAQRALGAVGVASDAAIATLIQYKQADAVAYPLHIVTAYTLSAADCSKDAVRLQWLKAGLHATGEGQPERIARELIATASGPDDVADLRRIVHTWTLRASDNRPLRLVLAALDRLR